MSLIGNLHFMSFWSYWLWSTTKIINRVGWDDLLYFERCWLSFFSAFENLPELSSKRIHRDLESFSFIPEKKQCSEPFSENSDTFVKSAFEAANIQRSPLSLIQLPQSQQTGIIADIPSAMSLAKLNNEQVDNSKIIINTVCRLFNLI